LAWNLSGGFILVLGGLYLIKYSQKKQNNII
jgi:uncharacterized membrane protein